MEKLEDVSFQDPFALSINGSSAPSEPTSAGATQGPRPYRSRKNRPCDFCRARKAACKIAVAPPCVLCHSYGKECTFNNNSTRKRSIPQNEEEHAPVAQRPRIDEEEQVENDSTNHQTTSPQSRVSSQSWSPPRIGHRRRRSSHVTWADEDPAAIPARGILKNGSNEHLETNKSFSFALNPTKSAVWVGDTGEADPWLCRRYQYKANDACQLSRISYQRIHPEPRAPRRHGINEDYEEPPLIFMLPEDGLGEKGEPRSESSTMDDVRNEVLDMIPDEVGSRMLKLVFRFVYPYFPVLSQEQMLSGKDIPSVLHSLPLSLLTAVYATSLPFLMYDDYLATAVIHSPPSASRLNRICWLAINQEMHAPRLGTLQACLLLLQRPPTNRYVMDTPFQWSFTAWTVGLASLLGLCKSCSGWSGLPKWELRLRGRLWWATYVMDKWSLLGAGMPTNISDEQFDVPEPTLRSDTGSYSRPSSPAPEPTDPHDLLSVPSHFYHLVHLTIILSDIVKAYYTVRATSQTAQNFSLSLELARPLRTRLKEWKQDSTAATAANIHAGTERRDSFSPTANSTLSNLALGSSNDPENGEVLDGNASLRLAYIVAAMTLYRALLRAVENHRFTGPDMNITSLHAAGRAAVLAGAKECAKEAIEFAEELSRGAVGIWDAFWHSWSRSNFALATSFLMRVLVNVNAGSSHTKQEEVDDVKALISRWRRVLRLLSGNSGNGMTSLSLLRLEGDLLQEKGLLKEQHKDI